MFCVNIDSVVNTILQSEKIVLCRETAAAFLGLSNGWGIPIRFYTDNTAIINSAYIQGHLIEDLEGLATIEVNNIACTNEEQTICDLIINDCDDQTVLESMANYYYNHSENFESLFQRALDLGIREQLDDYIKGAIEYYNE